MPVTIIKASHWHNIYNTMTYVLSEVGYPDNLINGSGGNGNVAVAVVCYSDMSQYAEDLRCGKYRLRSDGAPQWSIHSLDGVGRLQGNWWGIFAKNMGSGGDHSEVIAINTINLRSLNRGKDAYIFTERSACTNCIKKLHELSKHVAHVYEYYLEPYSDFDRIDRNAKSIDAQRDQPGTSAGARRGVKLKRQRYVKHYRPYPCK